MMAERPHRIACFVDGEWTGTAPAGEVASTLGMTEAEVLSRAHTTRTIRGTGIRLVDLDDFPSLDRPGRTEWRAMESEDVCPGCFMACGRPWPCPEALRRFAASGGVDDG